MQSSNSVPTLEERLKALQNSSAKPEEIAEALHQLAVAYATDKQQHYMAETSLWKELEIRRQSKTEDSSKMLRCLNKLAQLYDEQFRELEADRVRQLIEAVSSKLPQRNVLTMPIGDLLKQAGTILNTPIGEPHKKGPQEGGEAKPILESAQSPAKEDISVHKFLQQANSFLNTPLGVKPKPANNDAHGTTEPAAKANSNAVPVSKPQPNQQDPSSARPNPQGYNYGQRTPTSSQFFQQPETPEDFDGAPRCPHGQLLAAGDDSCLLCSVLRKRNSNSGEHNKTAAQTAGVSSILHQGSGRRYSLDAALWLGSSSKCDIDLSESQVPQNYQASIVKDGDKCWFNETADQSLATINGVSVKSKTKLQPGDLLVIGSTKLKAE